MTSVPDASSRRSLRRALRQARHRITRFRKQRLGIEVLYTYALMLDPNNLPELREHASLVPAEPEMFQRMHEQFPRELSERKTKLLQERVAESGTRSWVMRDAEGRSVGYVHAALQSKLNERINHYVKLRSHQAYFFDAYVFKKHRGQGVQSYSVAERMRILRPLGITEALLTISERAVASLASFSKFGIERRQTLIHVAPLQRTFAQPPVRYYLRRLTGRRERR